MEQNLSELTPSALTFVVLNSAGGVLKKYAPEGLNRYIPLLLIAGGIPLFMGLSGQWGFVQGIFGFVHAVGAVGLYETFKSTTGKHGA